MDEIIRVGELLAVGLLAGTLNTLVGGGTSIMLPFLVLFLGLDAQMANGTNRFSICFQTLAASRTLHSGGSGRIRDALPYALAAFAGGFAGAYLNTLMDGDQFRAVMGWVLLVGVAFFFLKPRRLVAGLELAPPSSPPLLGLVGAFAMGVYGGFLGAGVGVLILLFLTPLARLDLVRMLAVKVLMVLTLSISASAVYLFHRQVHWGYALPLVVANIGGGILGARLALRGGERWIRRAVAVVGAGLAFLLIVEWRPF
ncbi:MAG: sulfite exporter TauE/SafE family protein [Planctomycetota bacterium]